MTVFVFVFAAVAMALLALGWVLFPLLRGRRATGIALFVALATVSGLLYLLVGTPGALDPAQRGTPTTLADAVDRLQAELGRNPAQPEGWRLLGRAQAAQGQLDAARDSLARAVKLAPDEPDLLAEAAEARALARTDRRFDDAAVAMLRHALAQQPMHQRARWFLGIAQRQAGQHAEAAKTWEPLLGVVQPDTADSLRGQIDAARAEAGLAPLPETTKAPAGDALLRLTVELAPELAAQVGDGTVLYVLARKPGTTMPVAVKRLPARGFPLAIALDDGDSLMPTTKLSQAGQVEVLARISRSGEANRSAGDLESAALTVAARPDTTHALRIDRVVQ